MARSDGHGARSGHPAARRPAHQLDQPATGHYGEEAAGWPDSRDFNGQYSQEPYWQQPATPQGYEPLPPEYPSLNGGHPIEPMAPDPHYPAEPQHTPYAGGQDSYHYPQEPVFNPYEPTPPQPRAPDLGGGADDYGAQGFGAPGFPPFQDTAPGGFPLPNGYAEHNEYAPQYDPAYPPALEPQPNPFQGAQHHQAQSVGGQFHDYMDQAQPLSENSGASDYPDFNQHARFDNERAGLRGSDFEDWPRSDDARGQGGYESSSQFGPAAAAHGGYAEHDWQQKDNSYPLDSGPIFASAGYDTAQDLALHSEYEEDEYDEYEDDEEEPAGRSRARIGWILMALAAVVMIGGTLVYGYTILLGPAATELAQTPVVKSNSEPPKVRPENPGGRSFDHTDSKVLGRLSEQRNASSERADDGSRRVSTVVIGRDGGIVTPRDAPTPSTPPPANPVVTVPGLTLVDGFGGRQPPPTVAAASPQQPIVVQPPPSNAMPMVTGRSEPAPRNSGSAAPPPAAKPAERVERAPAQRTAALTPPKANSPVTTASTTPPAAASAAGYVAVLASVPVSASSRVDALAQYADIQQNYASVLGSRTPDVREANLGSRGRFHRLMVGPPGSKENAAALCAQLKTAGYSGCWITTY